MLNAKNNLYYAKNVSSLKRSLLYLSGSLSLTSLKVRSINSGFETGVSALSFPFPVTDIVIFFDELVLYVLSA